MSLLLGQKRKEYGLITSSRVIHNKMLILSGLSERLGMVGSVSICSIDWMKYKSMQRNGFGFIITKDHIKLTETNRY